MTKNTDTEQIIGKPTSDNIVMLIGKVSKITEQNNVTTVKVRIPRRGARGQVNFSTPKVYFFHTDNTGIQDFLLDDNVKITGHLVNTRKRRPNGTYFYSQVVIGDKIEKNESLFLTELNVDGFDAVSAQPVSLVYLHGKVEQISASGNRAYLIRLNAMQKGRNNHVNVTTYQKDTLLIQPGDEITVYGMIDTKTKEKDGQYRFYQNVVAQKLINHTRG